ncbi:MAG: HAMP domain-containing protein [Gammaproteobacteria bacterium]|nr:HAMP domain-containing protein [Gammaproteobacteria bacterium]
MNARVAVIGGISLLSLSLLVSLILMSAAIQNSERFGKLFSVLLVSNCIGLFAFAVLLVIMARQLIGQLRRRQPGARLTLRMLVIFTALSVFPILVLYGFSIDFLRRGVNSWFDVRISQALEDSLDLSKTSLDFRMRELLVQTEKLAEEIGQGSNSNAILDLRALRSPDSTVVANSWDRAQTDLDLMRQRSAAEELTLSTVQGHVIESSSNATDLVPSLSSEAILIELRQGRNHVGLEPLGARGFFVRVAAIVPDEAFGGEQRILHALYPLTEKISRLAASVESAYAKYHELVYLRDKLTLSFAMTLTLVLLSSIAVAAWAAFLSARRLAAPISDLAAGTAAVASGDYAKTLPVTSSDEMGFLVSSFNAMTQRIANARTEIENQHQYVRTLLGQLSSGVLALDENQIVTTLNDSGRVILDLGNTEILGRVFAELAHEREHARPFVELVSKYLGGPSSRWEHEVQIFSRDGRRVLICRGTPLSLKADARQGHVVVFDDITVLIKGQRDAAWSEVARRLAHEIKNPLTPIQLSAERLRQKYLGTLPAADAETLDRLTSTIVQQVDTMKRMVNTFSDYARPPAINQEQTDLNELLLGVVELYRSAHPEANFDLNFSPQLPMVSVDASRVRQVFNNLLKNALEAHPVGVSAHIDISSQLLASETSEYVEICISDRGEGIKAEILDTVFEPYVTNKMRGTGLGLAIVKKIIEEHSGVVTLKNNADLPGCSAVIRLPLQNSTSRLLSEINRNHS